MTDTLTRASDLLRQRIAELDRERKQLETALHNLTGERPSPRTRAARSNGAASRAKTSPARRPRRTVAPAGKRRQQLLEYLAKHPGARASEIAKALGVSGANVHNVLRSALTEGVVTKDGRAYSVKG